MTIEERIARKAEEVKEKREEKKQPKKQPKKHGIPLQLIEDIAMNIQDMLTKTLRGELIKKVEIYFDDDCYIEEIYISSGKTGYYIKSLPEIAFEEYDFEEYDFLALNGKKEALIGIKLNEKVIKYLQNLLKKYYTVSKVDDGVSEGFSVAVVEY